MIAPPDKVLPFYFGPPPRRLFGCYHPPPAQQRDMGVLLNYPMGSEYLRSHYTFVQIARRLAAAGLPSLRFDACGCGDSSGDKADADLEQWIADLDLARSELQRRAGCSRVAIVGLRMGASLAAVYGARSGCIDRMVLWSPLLKGRLALKEMASRQMAFDVRMCLPSHARRRDVPECLGFPLTDRLRAGMAQLDLMALAAPVAADVLLLETAGTDALEPWARHLAGLGVPVQRERLAEPPIWLKEEARNYVPAAVDRIVQWLSRGQDERVG